MRAITHTDQRGLEEGASSERGKKHDEDWNHSFRVFVE
jgi:hypothetical protein